ncbi:oocyte-secreted protein 3-like [Rhynchocyon petersi]
MKGSVAKGGLLLLLASLSAACSGQQAGVSVPSDHFHFQARVKRALFSNKETLNPEELYLGAGCPATEVRPDEFPVRSLSLSGILAQAFSDGTHLYSWLLCALKSQCPAAQLTLECEIPSQKQFID